MCEKKKRQEMCRWSKVWSRTEAGVKVVKMMGTRIKHLLFKLFPQPRDLSGAVMVLRMKGRSGARPCQGMQTMVVKKVITELG